MRSTKAPRLRGFAVFFVDGWQYYKTPQCGHGKVDWMGALARDHEPWPGGESRRRDLNHRLAAGPQASPDPSSSLCFNPASFAARQDTNAAQGRTRTRLLRRLHEHGIDGYGLRLWIFVSGEARFVSRGLPRTEGWNGAAAFDEGRWRRNVKWKPNRLQFDLQVKTATRHSSGKAARQAAAFRGRAQRKSNLPAHMEQYQCIDILCAASRS